MIKKFLRRFQKLEHAPASTLVIEECFSVAKRFERLEIGDKRIEITITDKISQQEKAPPNLTYYYYCPYCGKYNATDAQTCAYCKHSLKSRLTEQYQENIHLLKRCSCGAMNQKDRKNCWVCGRDFSLWSNEEVKESSDNVITLYIDGKTYQSTDKGLPLEIIILMEKIRREGYSAKIIDEWLAERNKKAGEAQINVEERLSEIRFNLTLRLIGLGAFLILVIFQISSCFRYLSH